MIPPSPFKLACKKCGYSKIIVPKSDVFPFDGWISTCPKCKGELERQEMNPLDYLIGMAKRFFTKG